MNDMILKYAQSPDCILAVTPDRGGAWWSPLRPGEGNPWPSDNPDQTPGLSEAERVRLISKTNVRTDRGVFEAADPGQGWSVATALDLGGRQTPLTAVVFFTPGEEDGSSYQAAHPLLTQGYRMSGTWQAVIFCLAYRKPTGSSSYVIELAAAFDESGGQNLKTVSKTLNSMTGRHCAGATWDPATGTCRLYLDGAMVAEAVWSDKAGLPFRADSSYPELNLHQSNASWQNFNDRIDAALVFSRVLSESEIAAMIPRREWVFEVEAGSISITTRGFQNQQWILPDGSISTAANLTGNVTAGTVICRYSGMDSYSTLTINAGSSNPAMLNTVLNINNLPPVTADLRITGVAGLTGNAVDLPRVTNSFYLNSIDDFYADAADLPRPSGILLLQNCPNITGSFADLSQNLSSFYCTGTGLTGTTADIPRATTVLNLAGIAGLTGDVADLPLNSGGRFVVFCAGITGALPVTVTNTTVSYHTNSSVAPAEYDQTVQNVVDAGAINGTLTISKNRTSASDANIQLLRDRGWTVVDA